MESTLIILSIPIFFAFIGVELCVARRRGRRALPLRRLDRQPRQRHRPADHRRLRRPDHRRRLRLRLRPRAPRHASRRARSSPGSCSSSPSTSATTCSTAPRHRVNFLWAGHVVHHQSEEYNLSVALRQSWFGQQLTRVGLLPAARRSPASRRRCSSSCSRSTRSTSSGSTRAWSAASARSSGCSTRRRTTACTTASTRATSTRNYAGIFIIWDRLFGTFEPEGDEPVYGLVKPLGSFNPLWANLHYWFEIGAHVAAHAPPASTRSARLVRAARVAPGRSRRHRSSCPSPIAPARRCVRHAQPHARSLGGVAFAGVFGRRLVVHLRRRHRRRGAAGDRRRRGPGDLAGVITLGAIYSPAARAMIASAPRRSRR